MSYLFSNCAAYPSGSEDAAIEVFSSALLLRSQGRVWVWEEEEEEAALLLWRRTEEEGREEDEEEEPLNWN